MTRIRKPRAEPLSQGVIRTIWRLFFGPLVHYKPDNISLRDWLEEMFDAKNRDISRWRANQDFRLPGYFCPAPLMKIQGLGYRAVKEGDTLWVRQDARNPDQVDVEYLGGQGRADQMFCLTRMEWEWARLRLDDAEKVRK